MILSFRKDIYAINLDKGALGEDGSMIINIMGHAALKMKKKSSQPSFYFSLHVMCLSVDTQLNSIEDDTM